MTAPIRSHLDVAREEARAFAAFWFPYSPTNRAACENDLLLMFQKWWNAGFSSGLEYEVVSETESSAEHDATTGEGGAPTTEEPTP